MTFHKHFAPPPPSHLKKKFSAPFLPWKLWVREACNSIFTGKFVAIFFNPPPPYKGHKILSQSPLFAPGPLLTSVCERSLKASGKMSNQNISLTKTTMLWDFQEGRISLSVMRVCLHFTAISCFLFYLLTFACFCEILYVAYSAFDVCFCLVSYIVYIFGNQVGIFVHTHSLLSREIVRKSIMSCLHFRIKCISVENVMLSCERKTAT